MKILVDFTRRWLRDEHIFVNNLHWVTRAVDNLITSSPPRQILVEACFKFVCILPCCTLYGRALRKYVTLLLMVITMGSAINCNTMVNTNNFRHGGSKVRIWKTILAIMVSDWVNVVCRYFRPFGRVHSPKVKGLVNRIVLPRRTIQSTCFSLGYAANHGQTSVLA